MRREERWAEKAGMENGANIRRLFYVACQYLLMRISTMICIVQFESNILLTCRKLLWTGALESLRVPFSGTCQGCYNFSNSLLLCMSSSFIVWGLKVLLLQKLSVHFYAQESTLKIKCLTALMTLRMCNLKPMCIHGRATIGIKVPRALFETSERNLSMIHIKLMGKNDTRLLTD